MRSVADDHRRESTLSAARLSADDRLALALRLGDDDVALYCTTHGVDASIARRVFRGARAVGRRPSVANVVE